jgi:hypothetical protein
MSTVTLQHVLGRELAARLGEALRLDPDRAYTVTVQAEDEELARAASLKDVMDVVGRRAEERGMTPDVLRKILNDA